MTVISMMQGPIKTVNCLTVQSNREGEFYVQSLENLEILSFLSGPCNLLEDYANN